MMQAPEPLILSNGRYDSRLTCADDYDLQLDGFQSGGLPADGVSAAIALGSNLGNSQQILLNAMTVLDTVPGIRVSARSHLYKTAPVGPPQPDYINACITVQTSLPPRDLLHRLLAVEQQFGRVRKERWGARSLDLDLLLFGDRIIAAPKLSIPHPRLHERPFVLVPLMDIAAHWLHPVLHQTVEQLFTQLVEQGLGNGVEKIARAVSYESQTVF
ncbi:MAG: 2-amino-4-hydroxy-6-hydroxymethyldihydropteridine diphosphokinase [Phormidesmis sp.]